MIAISTRVASAATRVCRLLCDHKQDVVSLEYIMGIMLAPPSSLITADV